MGLARSIQLFYYREIKRRLWEWQFSRQYDIYRGRGEVRIAKIPDDKLVTALKLHLSDKAGKIGNQLFRNGECGEYEAYGVAILEYLNPYEQAILLATKVDDEVCNGGFNQYYFNTQGRFEEATHDAYLLIGATEHAEVFNEAAQFAPSLVDKHATAHKAETTEAVLERFSESCKDNPLHECDTRYYRCSPDIEEILVTFIRKNASQFPKERI